MPKAKSTIQIKNRRASFDYEFLETYTAGIQLVGERLPSRMPTATSSATSSLSAE